MLQDANVKRFSPDQLIFALVLGAVIIGIIIYRSFNFF